ncbi:unnamed protein product [Schistosoma mattheei]|uniref:DUF5580 domain-containing protein n=1 Tax=Schistosoma mattheei TaxID=31246 RepID=A0AA85B1V0_9TREM|nr:unnamed protein product [Schistosoma mattheei]
MEKHKTQFEQADYQLILNKLITILNNEQCDEIIKYAVNQDPDDTGTFGFDQMINLINQLTGKENALTTHELGTLARHYGVRPSKEINLEILLGIAQQTLRRKAFEDFSSLMNACRQQDADKTGEMDRHAIRRICLAHHLPLPDDMLNSLMNCLVNQNNLIQYEQFINQLNWKNYEIKELSIQQSLDYIENMNIDWLPISKGDMPKSIHLSKKSKIDKINYKQLINDLFMKDLFHSSID